MMYNSTIQYDTTLYSVAVTVSSSALDCCSALFVVVTVLVCIVVVVVFICTSIVFVRGCRVSFVFAQGDEFVLVPFSPSN